MERLSVCGWTPPIFPFQKAVKTHRRHKFTLKNCRECTGEDAPPSGTSSAFAILGVQPTCSATELKAAFRAKVKQFHPDVNRTGKYSDMMIRRVIQAYEMLSNYSRSEIIERECVDPFDNPECEAFDVFVNEVLCVGKDTGTEDEAYAMVLRMVVELGMITKFSLQLVSAQEVAFIMLHLYRKLSWRSYKANPFCNWTGITCHPHFQHRVVGLELIDMDLQGGISPFISNMSLLTTLSLQGNRFYGKIPSSLGGLSELAFLNVSENNLEGNIPGSLHGCQSLKVVDLNYNNPSGIILKELSWMKNLTYLCLSQNRLTGVLPSSLSNLTELTQLELAVNYFTGKIPPQLGALRKLEILYLHMNFLEGSVPTAISNCTALREISLTGNLLSGEIPLELGAKLQNLQKLYMIDNELSGKIPVTLSNLSQLTLLDLSLNNLEGEVPAELGMLKNLEVLYFHSFSTFIPTTT
ncbi:hypothetical protein ACE6H2_022225 [Prunus campanulata]